MNKKSLFSLTTIALLLFSSISFSQETLNLGILTSFEGYTGAGAVTNSGGTVTGDVGTHLGIISGLELPDYTGNKYNSDADTDQARKDLLRLYIHLNDKFVDFPGTHAAAFANETLSPGVYSIDGAGSIGGALILDGGPNDFFIFKMNGALTVGAAATVTLTGGVQSCNVFWLVNGAISVAADAEVKGTLFSKTGAVGLGAGTLLEGRMLTMGGAITLGVGAEATRPSCTSTIPIFCEADCSSALDILGVLSDFTLFASAGNVANTGISGINGKIGTNAGTITGFGLGIHIQDEEIANTLTQQAADDLDAAYDALMLLTATGTHPAAYLNETITPGVYDITGAGSLGGTVTLDALGDPDAIFVFRFSGAFNIAALSKMILANGARRCNIFWLGGAGVVTGAVNIGASAQIKGNFISHGGACNSGGGVFMSGRQLATFGAVNTNTAVIYANPECVNSTPLGAAIALVKTASVGGMVGDVITYTFTVTNTGTSTLNNIEVTDPMEGLSTLTGSPIPSLAVGASSDITATYTITQADGDEGTVTNSAMVTSDEGVTDVSGTTIDNDTPTVTTIVQTPAVALVKTATLSGSGILGDVITYTFTVTNTGTSTLNNIVVTDPMIITSFIGSPILSLAVGASSDITATYTITQADIDTGSVTNSATVTSDEGATDVSGTTIDNNTSTITTIPAVALVKTATLSGSGILGDVITYTFRVTNTGTSTLNNIVVTDPMAGLSSLTGSPILSLAVGASSDITATYTITQSDIDTGSVTNSALVTAQDPDGNDITDVSGTTIDNNTSTITTIPAVALVKTAIVSGTGTLGDVITYTFRVTNTGTSTLNNIVVTDPMVGLSSLTGSPILSLAVGASSDITATYTITQSDIDTGSVTNSALVTAQDPDGNDITDVSGTEIDNDTSTITTITQTQQIALVKTAIVSGTGALGDVITYIFTVENTGNTTLTNVVVTDPMLGLVITGSPILSLAVGVSSVITGTYTIIQSDIDTGNVTNTATATSDEGATDISGTANDNDDSTITTITQTPAIALVKTAIVSGTGILGDVITYTFAVTNTGNTTLTNILVTDPMVGLAISGSPISSLAVGASSSVIIGTYTITQSDIDTGSVTNSATATSDEGATDVSGTEIDNDTSTITTITKTPAIALVKTAIVSGTGTLGDVITYIFRVENTGNTTLTNIVVTDPMVGLAISGSPISSLAVGVSSVITGTYTIIQSDIDTGNVTNTATATSDEGATDISGTANDNDTPTVTPIITLPDFTPTIDIEGLVFPEAGDKKDFVINISEINGEPSDGQVVVKIIKGDAFLITAKSNITIGGNTVTTNNGDWTIVQGLEFITITLETSIIVANSFSSIGFEIERKPNVPAQTTQPITVTIENGSGGDSYNNNNTYNTVVQAQ
jgi:uncharacterized repeat protein (TIGR01451 family)